jgi:hypothetical protein
MVDDLNNFGVEEGWSSRDLYLRMVGDVTGDFRADIVGFQQNGVYVAPSYDFLNI